MASSPSPTPTPDPIPIPIPKPISHFLHSTTSHLLSLLPHPKTPPPPSPPPLSPSSNICIPLQFPDSPLPLTQLTRSSFNPAKPDSVPSKSAAMKGMSSSPDSRSGFPSTVRVEGLSSSRNDGGPAFVGQVFTMVDFSGRGLTAVPSPTRFDIPFISKRASEWLKKMFATITKSERNDHVSRFFMDVDDADTYVKQRKIPNSTIGACRLDLAYEYFKGQPHSFQFVPNGKQVKAANKLLKEIPQNDGRRSIEGVPVFSAQNLEIAIATTDGIKWYTPYFFDKSRLDNILEKNVDQHFHTIIKTRDKQRRRDVIDDSLPGEVTEDMEDSLWEPPEVEEVMDEMGHPGIPLSVISKAAEIELLYAVDRVLLGNRWLRKATGIQPKFPYMVDSFEKRTAASFLKASESTSYLSNSGTEGSMDYQNHGKSELESKDNHQANKEHKPDFRFPFGDWFSNPFLKQPHKPQNRMEDSSQEYVKQDLQANPLLPKFTMFGILIGEGGQVSKSNLKKTMMKLTKELEQIEQGNAAGSNGSELKTEDRDPLFVANVGDYSSRMGSSPSVRRGRVKHRH